jgi:hypothetical protein
VTRILALGAVVTAAVVLVVPSVARPWSPPAQATYADVVPSSGFYTDIEALAAVGSMGGYACGGPGEPCDALSRPYFREFVSVTRGQLARIVASAASVPLLNPPAGSFADVAPASPFYVQIETLAAAGVVSGYACGGPGEPCDAIARPYFRPYANVTRAQAAKVVALATGLPLANPPVATFADVAPATPFYVHIETLAAAQDVSGYSCGAPAEPCDAIARPYFRPYAYMTRAQVAKLVAQALVFSDTTAPTLAVPAALTVDATGPVGAAVTYAVGATDPDDPMRTTSCTPAPGSTFAIGTTTVTCAASDTHLNTATATFVVTVNGAVAQVDALLRTLDDSVLAKPLLLARGYLLKKDVADACAQLAEFDREAAEAKLVKLLAASARIELVVGCRS